MWGKRRYKAELSPVPREPGRRVSEPKPRELERQSPSRRKGSPLVMVKTEGFFDYTPMDPDTRSIYVEITSPDPDPHEVSRDDVRRVMRWEVSAGRTRVRGVCATGGHDKLMADACRVLGMEHGPEASYRCAYGLVDMRGRPLYPRSRAELWVLDEGAWPDYRECECEGCRELFGDVVLLTTSRRSEVE